MQRHDPFPDLGLKRSDGSRHSIQQHHGRNVVLLCTPHADDPDAMIETDAFREALPLFQQMNADIVAVSNDSPRRNRRVATARGVPFEIVSDRRRHVAQALGIDSDGPADHQTAAILVDAEGRVVKVFRGNGGKSYVGRVTRALRDLERGEAWTADGPLPD